MKGKSFIQLTPYQFKKYGFERIKVKNSGFNQYSIPLSKNDSRELVYCEEEKTLFLSNVYLNRLREVNNMEQINAVYKSLTDKSFIK